MIAILAMAQPEEKNEQKDKDKEPTKDKIKLREKATAFGGKLELKIDDNAAKNFKTKGVYTVYVINKSTTWTIIATKVGAGGWISLPQPIGLTCNLGSCKDCLDNGKFLPLAAVPCESAPFDIYAMLKNSAGQLAQAGPARISPDCSYQGEAVCLDIP